MFQWLTLQRSKEKYEQSKSFNNTEMEILWERAVEIAFHIAYIIKHVRNKRPTKKKFCISQENRALIQMHKNQNGRPNNLVGEIDGIFARKSIDFRY